MNRYQIVVPKLKGDGTPYEPCWLEASLVTRLGGFTKHDATGAWGVHDSICYDNNIVYTVDTEVNADAFIKSVAEEVKSEAAQEEVYVTKQEIQVLSV